MFDSQEFQKNKFILERIKFDYANTGTEDSAFMHIAFNVNDKFVMQTGVAITSICESNSWKNFYFHVFCDGMSDANKEKLRQTAVKYRFRCCIYVMDMLPFQAFHIKTKHFSRVTYLRTVMPKILQELTDRYLYMDADMICLGDISELERIDLQGYPFAAATETDEAVAYKTSFLKMKGNRYFNDGLMWVDIPEWERERITERAFEYQGADPKRFSGQSQDILNLVLDGGYIFFRVDTMVPIWII
jgi:lipopolysaccharide biosynthesis glycosyltransferase